MTFDGGKTQYILTRAQRRYLPVKRTLDVVLSLALLLLLVLPMLLVALVQKLACPSEPVLFRQARVGRGGALFTLVKFRTMQSGGESGSADATGFGRFLRASSIDELPQLALVLTGKMSLIGPRPLIPQEETVHALRRAAGVYQLRPGLTGWAQIHGRDRVQDGEKATLDREYLERLSFSLDWRIFWSTIGKVIGRDGVLESGQK